ncbi:MAG: hypothetical protein WB680_10310 [Candidatus Acidiferrales bacterium]
MSKPIKRRCPRCGEVKLFRADQKTCGCPKPDAAPKVDPLVGRYFIGREHQGQPRGKVVARISSSKYLVHLEADYGDMEQLMTAASMKFWLFGDSSWYAIQMALREMEDSES